MCVNTVMLLLLFVFYKVVFLFSLERKRFNQFYHDTMSVYREILHYNGPRQMKLVSVQWDLKSRTWQGVLLYPYPDVAKLF